MELKDGLNSIDGEGEKFMKDCNIDFLLSTNREKPTLKIREAILTLPLARPLPPSK